MLKHEPIVKCYSAFELGFLDNFKDLGNVFEMVAETSVLPVKTTRARVAKRAVSDNNTCTCTCRTCNLISAEKATFHREKCLAML